MNKRHFISGFLLCCITLPAAAFNIEETNIKSIQQAIAAHEITCVELISQYIERIKQFNLSASNAAPINAFTQINTSALTEAANLDKYFADKGQLAGALHCVPVVLKDNIDSYDTTTSSGSYALLGNQPVKDAELTSRLRNAGAIIIGKGGMDEFAWGMSGLSSRSGRIGNVYNTAMNPGGSSGGVAAAVSANFAVVGVGTDNSGSVRIPAAFNGLIGLRPTKNLISQRGIFPMGNIDGTAGPMARTTRELAMLLDALASHAATPSYTSYLKQNGLHGKRIGIVHLVGTVDPFEKINGEVDAAITTMKKLMEANGAELVEVTLPAFNNDRSNNQAGEIEDINQYLTAFPAARKNFQDICESDRTRNFGDVQQCLAFMNTIPAKQSASYQQALNMIKANRQYVEKFMREKKLDALMMPLSKQAAGKYDEMAVNTWQAALSSNAGLPAISFVIGYNQQNMPIGIDITSAANHEGTLIEIAYAYEQLTHWRREPTMPSADIKMSSLSIPQINNLIAEIGKQTYDQYIKPATSQHHLAAVITAPKFTRIVKNTLNL